MIFIFEVVAFWLDEIYPKLLDNADFIPQIEHKKVLEKPHEEPYENINSGGEEVKPAELNSFAKGVLHPGIITLIHIGKLIALGQHQWIAVMSVSFFIHVHRRTEQHPECVSWPHTHLKKVEDVHLLEKISPGIVFHHLNLLNVARVPLLSALFFYHLYCVGHGPRVYFYPLIND